jgi:hypothetical protein
MRAIAGSAARTTVVDSALGGKNCMRLPKVFRSRKSRKYPVKRDEQGRSARSRCFKMFFDNVPLDDIVGMVDVTPDTVRRYYLQWRQEPVHREGYAYARHLFARANPHRDSNLEPFARAWGITKEQLEITLSQPHGLRRLVTGKIYAPAHQAADYRRHVALKVAVLIADHLTKKGGTFEDVCFSFQRWMEENKKNRQQKDADIQDDNRDLEIMHKVLEADAENERAGRVKPDTLSEEERDAILRYGVQLAAKKAETAYWLRIASLMGEGLTPEQGREKIYRDLLAKDDLKGAAMVRQFQARVHPLKDVGNVPPPEPPPPA